MVAGTPLPAVAATSRASYRAPKGGRTFSLHAIEGHLRLVHGSQAIHHRCGGSACHPFKADDEGLGGSARLQQDSAGLRVERLNVCRREDFRQHLRDKDEVKQGERGRGKGGERERGKEKESRSYQISCLHELASSNRKDSSGSYSVK